LCAGARARVGHICVQTSLGGAAGSCLGLDRALAWIVPCATVVAAAGDGIPSFLRALDARGTPSVCEVASDFGVRLPAARAVGAVNQAPHTRGHPKKPHPAPRHDVQTITAAHPEEAWRMVQWRAGSRGALP
jgi:DDE superfamily endonuclease